MPNSSINSSVTVVPRWELSLAREPQYQIAFWNVYNRALSTLSKTNNAMEAAHLQFSVQNLNRIFLKKFPLETIEPPPQPIGLFVYVAKGYSKTNR